MASPSPAPVGVAAPAATPTPVKEFADVSHALFGFHLGLPGADAPIGLGWDIGVLFGGAVHLTSKFGLFAEVGWEQHRITHSNDTIADVDIKLQQALLNLGVIVRN